MGQQETSRPSQMLGTGVSLLKRTLKGTYTFVEPWHLHRYLDEQAFRYNERKDALGDRGRFMKVARGCAGKRLTYSELIGKSKATVDRV